MDEQNLMPFRVAKYFEEHVPQVLESLSQDPEGMYQFCYRVGDVIISAHVWRESLHLRREPEYSAADREFLRQCKVSPEDGPSDALL